MASNVVHFTLFSCSSYSQVRNGTVRLSMDAFLSAEYCSIPSTDAALFSVIIFDSIQFSLYNHISTIGPGRLLTTFESFSSHTYKSFAQSKFLLLACLNCLCLYWPGQQCRYAFMDAMRSMWHSGIASSCLIQRMCHCRVSFW